MADKITGIVEPSAHGGEGYFTFSLDGMSTSKQMEKLIGLTEDLVKRIVGKNAESLKQQKAQTAAIEDSTAAITSETDARKTSEEEWNKSTRFISNIFHGRLGVALEDSSKGLTAFAAVTGYAWAKLEKYGDALGEGLKRGVAGSTFDLAIAAKSAGVSVTTFTKALGESGGAFASLGSGATSGAKEFGGLVKNVRLATADVGNLGMNLDEMAIFTAQQTKTAILQGFKGKAAQDVVIKNSRELGKELDVLASRTGKSVMEMAQAALKLSQDPVVSNFVRNMKYGNKEVSASIQTFAASLNGLLGEEGDKISTDAIQSAISGLPMTITETGKNIYLAGTGIFEEINRQAQLAKNGTKITEQDQERLRDMIMQTAKARETELASLSMIPGPAGDSARQFLKLANAASTYNSEENIRDRKRADSAKQFNAELRSLQASFQEMMIPLLKALNAIDWATVFQVISFIPRKIAEVMDFFSAMIKKLPEPLVSLVSGIGSIVSTLGSSLIGLGVLFGGIAVLTKLFEGGLGIVGKGMSMLGIKLPEYASKYTLVNRALESFTAALYKASIAAKVGGGGSTIISGGGKGKTPAPGSLSGWQTGATAAGQTAAEAASKTAGKGLLYRAGYGAGKLVARAGSGPVGLFAGIAADMLSDLFGRETFWGKVADTVSTTATFAGMGGAGGALVGGGIGSLPAAAVGAIGGGLFGLGSGLYKNFFSDDSGSVASDITSQASASDNPVLRAQLASIEQQKKTNDLMLESINEQAIANRLASLGLGKDDDLARRVSNLNFNSA